MNVELDHSRKGAFPRVRNMQKRVRPIEARWLGRVNFAESATMDVMWYSLLKHRTWWQAIRTVIGIFLCGNVVVIHIKKSIRVQSARLLKKLR